MCKAISAEKAQKLTQANADKKTAREESEQGVLTALVGFINKRIEESAKEGNDILQIINPSVLNMEADEDAPEDQAIRALFSSPDLALGLILIYREAGFSIEIDAPSRFEAPDAITISWGEEDDEDDED